MIQRIFGGSANRNTWLLMAVLFCLNYYGLNAQFNLKIAYDGAYVQAPLTNEVIRRYNDLKGGSLNEPAREMHWMHGINMGARYKWAGLATDLSWESLGTAISAVEINGDAGSEKVLYFRLNHISWSSEWINGPLGIGASLDLGFYRMQSSLSGTSARRKLAAENPISSKLFLSFYIRGSDVLSFVIRPYYRVQWNNALPVGALSEYLTGSGDPGQEKMHQFGLSFCFYNGPQ